MRNRALPAAVIASTVAHGAIALWIALDEPDPDEIVVAVTDEPRPIAPVEIEPVAFELLAPAAVAAATRSQDGDVIVRAATRTITSTTSRGSEIAPPTQPDSTKPGRRNPLAMRKPEVAGMSPEFVADFLARTKPLPEVPDLPGARIDARIAGIRDQLKDPRFVANKSPEELAAMRADLVGLAQAREQVELQANKDGTYTTEKETFIAQVGKDGKVKLVDKPNFQVVTPFHFKFDVTDGAMRAAGIDPYSAAKLRYLDRTRDQRVEIGKQHSREQLAQSAEYARLNVERLWRQTSDLAARKQGLFDLWDECEESGDAARVAGGEAARKFIIRFIQVKLTGRDAYTVDDLARLNKVRRSKQRFVP
ncbi:MAG TPA: hypothetical protein VIU61_05760 [Kofleriaceae bacterium]